MNAHGIRTRGSVATLALVMLGATACGSSSPKSASTTQPPTSTVAAGSDSANATATTVSGDATTTTAAAGNKTGHVGDTLTDPDQYVPADVATVTLVKVIDPATPVDPLDVAAAGTRWVGLEMTIVDNGDNARVATNTVRVTLSNGKHDSAFDHPFTECTSTFHDLQTNQKATFCPGYLVPNGAKITTVGWTTRNLSDSVPAEITWTVP